MSNFYLWTIYKNPSDYPGKFVARKWVCDGKDNHPIPDFKALVRDTLREIREAIPQGMHRMKRHPSDDACIVETWI